VGAKTGAPAPSFARREEQLVDPGQRKKEETFILHSLAVS
jgi:hypothetical protein